MSELILPKNHYALNAVIDTAAICQPLLETLGITYFCYMRYFNDNTCYVLTTRGDFLQYRLKKGYKFNPLVPSNMLQEKIIYIPTINDSYSQIIADYLKLFNAAPPIYLIERYEGYFDSFHFSGKANNQNIINIYLNNIEILERFKFYFKEKAKKLIEKSSKNKLFIPDNMQPCFKGLNKLSEKDAFNKDKHLRQMIIKRYILSGKYEGIALPKQEVNTLKYLANGNSIKEIGKLMHISPRTAQYYINSAKNRLKIQKKSELIKIALNLV